MAVSERLDHQNGINYQLTVGTLSSTGFTEQSVAEVIDKVGTFLLCLGNTPYHSPLWLSFGVAMTSYSTYIYSESLLFCGGTCKTAQNAHFQMPAECAPFLHHDDGANLCTLTLSPDALAQCTECQCLDLGEAQCADYGAMGRGHEFSAERIRLLLGTMLFVMVYLRQMVGLSLWFKMLFLIAPTLIHGQCHWTDCVVSSKRA